MQSALMLATALRFLLVQQDAAEKAPSAPKASDDSKMIIIEEGSRRSVERGRKAQNVNVETGTADIVSEDLATIAAARRSWDQECRDWKNELRSLNKNNLLVSDCGRPVLKDSMHQSEKSYRYESSAKYKIRVTAE